MTIQAIETHYAGHRFRSRLEARWAVFLDTLGIKWEYEPQGYLVGPEGGQTPYLPDFYLPKEKLWVEVKGSEDQLNVQLLVNASVPHYGLPNCSWHGEYWVSMLVLGPIGRPSRIVETDNGAHVGYSLPTHALLSFRKGCVFQGTAYFTETGVDVEPDMAGGAVGSDGPDVYEDTRGRDWGNLVGGGCLISDKPDERVIAAFRAARSARFEHGETPA